MNFQLITKSNILHAGQNQPSYAGPTTVKILKRAAIQREVGTKFDRLVC